jgi:hypothetical protein
MFEPITQAYNNETVIFVFTLLYQTAFVWLPVLLGIVLWDVWVTYRRTQFLAAKTYIVLEIKLPREIFKSPRAAEFFISSLYSTIGEGNWYEKYWKGSVRSWFSLELASIDGEIHFFIWTQKGDKSKIEANLYSQYPGIEVYEVPDYTLPVSYNPETTGMWATEFDLTEKDYFPIKTYIDYGMDKDPKEEYKIDPMTPLIDFLGSLSRGQQVWIQIIARAHVKEDTDPKTGEKVDLKWKKGATGAIKDIITEAKGEKDKEGKLIPGTGRYLTDGETEKIKALERSVSKNGFDVGIRVVYIAPKDIFNMGNVGGIVGGIMHFNSPLNGFKPARGAAPKHSNIFLKWKDRPKKTIDAEKQHLLDAYKRRAYFFPPFKSPHMVLNTEELATLYHFPGGVSVTPAFSRIGSKKSDAPSNLPI